MTLSLLAPERAAPALPSADELGRRLTARLDALAAFSDEPGGLTRLFLSPAHARAVGYLRDWCGEIGVEARLDAAGTLVARYEGARPGLPALLIGSHIDTVRQAGRYDGALGVAAGLGVLEELARTGERLPFAIEVLAFGDEEGVRFPTTLTGSRALAGDFDRTVLAGRDDDGLTLAQALRAFGCDPEAIDGLARGRRDVHAYVELHIEQGPVLEAEGLALGVVTAISGATRLAVEVAGTPGHSGTVPMALRRDALAAAARMVVAVEDEARARPGIVATVGRIEAHPGAVNVIPGLVGFSVDLRSPDDAQREAALASLTANFARIAAARRVDGTWRKMHEAAAMVCDARLVAQLEAAVARTGQRPRRLPSGAGHDAMVMGALCPTAMLFLRCRGGISHNPAESITPEDAGAGLSALLDFVRRFEPAAPARI